MTHILLLAALSLPSPGGRTRAISPGALKRPEVLVAVVRWDDSYGCSTNGCTFTGNVNLGNSLLLNIGNANTDFTASGGLNLAGDLAIATNKFTVASASGNTAVAGTFAVTSTSTFTDLATFNNGATVNQTFTTNNAAIFNATARFVSFARFMVDSRSIVSNGAGTPAALTLLPTSSYVEITCSDPDGCNITMDETISQGAIIFMCVVSGTVNFADSSGVSELAGAYAAGADDCITLIYGADRYRELGRSNN